MIVLVANLGSTSFKFKLFDMADGERVIATGAADRIGNPPSSWEIEVAGEEVEGEASLADHGEAIELFLTKLAEAGVEEAGRLEAIGFKAVHGGPISGAVVVDDHVLSTMQDFADVAPAHNPPYIAAMKSFMSKLPEVPQVAAFETAYHQTIPMSRLAYATPYEWIEEYGLRRYGFHGASHRYIATRMAEIAPECKKIINCHLGGSCSICAIEDGKSVANSFGLTPQTGLPHSGRVGDIDIYALLKLKANGIEVDEVLQILGKKGGLLGLSGVSSDMREVEAAANEGNERAQLALDVFTESIKQYIGSYLAFLNGVDAICFTGGIGQHQKALREEVLKSFSFIGLKLDAEKNNTANGKEENQIHADDSAVKVFILPTNEELIVARQAVETLSK